MGKGKAGADRRCLLNDARIGQKSFADLRATWGKMRAIASVRFFWPDVMRCCQLPATNQLLRGARRPAAEEGHAKSLKCVSTPGAKKGFRSVSQRRNLRQIRRLRQAE